MIGAHPTYDPTNPLHRLADDAARMASGAYPRRPEDLAGIARDIDEVLTLVAALQAPDTDRKASASDLRVRMFSQPSTDPAWMHFWFTRAPTEDERQAIARAVSLRAHYLAPANTPTPAGQTGRNPFAASAPTSPPGCTIHQGTYND